MNLLLVGGSGGVGTAITPYLAAHHAIRVLDLQTPKVAGVEWIEGSITDPDRIRQALDGVDAFINLVMQMPQGGSSTDQDIPTIRANYEVNTVGLHLLLWCAQERGVSRGVHTSTMSVHHRAREWYPSEETVPLDSPSVYGLTKGLGEHICEYFCRWFDMRIVALRITGPRTRSQYLAEREAPIFPGLNVTDEEDLARAYLSSLEFVSVGHGRFDAIFVVGDESESTHNLSKAKSLLGWTPESHKYLDRE